MVVMDCMMDCNIVVLHYPLVSLFKPHQPRTKKTQESEKYNQARQGNDKLIAIFWYYVELFVKWFQFLYPGDVIEIRKKITFVIASFICHYCMSVVNT